MPADLPELRLEVTRFSEAMVREFYLHYSGQKDTLSLEPLYRRFGPLFSRDLAGALQQRMATDSDRTADSDLGNLYSFVAQGFLGQQIRDLRERIAALEARLTVEVAGETLGYRQLTNRMQSAATPALRRDYLEASKTVLEQHLAPLYRTLWEQLFALVHELGCSSYLQYCERIHRLDYAPLNLALQQFLAATAPLYEREFDRWLRAEAGLSLKQAHAIDVNWLLRGGEFDAAFPAAALVPALARFTADLGIPLEQQAAIHLDLEPRPGKSSRAFCSPVHMGTEIYITLDPAGGMNDTLTLLHEVGHAYHFAYTDPSLPAERQLCGDRAISEGFAFLFNHLPENPAWVARYYPAIDPQRFVRTLLLKKLWMLRRYSAKLNYELVLGSALTLDAADTLYVHNLEDALLVGHEPLMALIDLDFDLYCADYLRAWIWELQLRRHLEQQFGLEWFAQPAAGAALIELWRLGESLPVEQLAQHLGLPGLQPELLLDHFAPLATR